MDSKMLEVQGYASNFKIELSFKDKMINQLRDAMNAVVVNKIKLDKKNVIKDELLKTLQEQLILMMEKAMNAGADVTDYKEINIEVQSEAVDPKDVGDVFKDIPELPL